MAFISVEIAFFIYWKNRTKSTESKFRGSAPEAKQHGLAIKPKKVWLW